MIYFILFYFLP